MRPSASRLVRLIPKSALLQNPTASSITPPLIIRPAPRPQTEELSTPTLMDILMTRQAEKLNSEEGWPANIRLEPTIKKEAFKTVHKDVRTRLKKLLKER